MYQNWKKYILVLFITIALFSASWYSSRTINKEKVAQLQTTQDEVAVAVLSRERAFDKGGQLDACATAEKDTSLSEELSVLSDKIEYGEKNLNAPEQLVHLKKQYTLTQAKEFLLVKRINERCKSAIPTILYFYSTKETCTECGKQADVLDVVRRLYPNVRVYSFDYNLDSPTIRAFRKIYKIKGQQLPAIVVNGKTYNGFMTLQSIEKILPQQ